MFQGRNIFLISGPGGSGKDTLARMLAKLLEMNYGFSTSFGAAHAFWHSIQRGEQAHRGIVIGTYINFEHFYADRVNRRREWADFISDINKADPVGLYRYCLEKRNDFLIGIRRVNEIEAIEAEGWIDFRIWIEDPEIKDETQEYGPERCDISIINHKSGLENLRRKVLTMLRFLQFPVVGLIAGGNDKRDEANNKGVMQRLDERAGIYHEQEALAKKFHEYNSESYRQARERATPGDVPDAFDEALVRDQTSIRE